MRSNIIKNLYNGVIYMIRQENLKELPPRPYLEEVMDGVAKLYCFLWDLKDKDYRVSLSFEEILKHFNKNNFRTNLRKINNTGLISYRESEKGVSIELVGWDK